MTQEEKQLLLKDLCGRLPYGVMAYASEIDKNGAITDVNISYNMANLTVDNASAKYELVPLFDIKPYLRPLSSMTEEEDKELRQMFEIELSYLASNEEGHTVKSAADSAFEVDFYNRHHFDYRGLIEKGLALEAPEGMYKTE